MITTSVPYASTAQTSYNSPSSPRQYSQRQAPGFGVVDGGCCSGPACGIGCATILGLILVPFLAKPIFRGIRSLFKGLGQLGNTLKNEIK